MQSQYKQISQKSQPIRFSYRHFTDFNLFADKWNVRLFSRGCSLLLLLLLKRNFRNKYHIIRPLRRRATANSHRWILCKQIQFVPIRSTYVHEHLAVMNAAAAALATLVILIKLRAQRKLIHSGFNTVNNRIIAHKKSFIHSLALTIYIRTPNNEMEQNKLPRQGQIDGNANRPFTVEN